MTAQNDSHPAQDASTRSADPSVVEDVLLLLFQPDSGTIAGENILFYVLGGAVVAELALTDKVEAQPSGLLSRRVHAVGDTPPLNDLLSPAWDYISTKPRDVQTVLAAIGPRLREPVLDRLVERGDLHRGTKKTLGIFQTTTLALGSGRRQDLLERVRAALIDGEDPEPRIAAIIALLSASDTLPYFDREIPWSSTVYTRGKEFERGDWGAAAAASAVTRTMTAIILSGVVTSTVMPRS